MQTQAEQSLIFRAVNQRALQLGFPADIAAKIAANVERNFQVFFQENPIGGIMDAVTTLEEDSGSGFLSGAFFWGGSNEGADYWCDIYANLPNILVKKS